MTSIRDAGLLAISALEQENANEFITKYANEINAIINSGDIITSTSVMYRLDNLQKNISTFCTNKINIVEELKRRTIDGMDMYARNITVIFFYYILLVLFLVFQCLNKSNVNPFGYVYVIGCNYL